MSFEGKYGTAGQPQFVVYLVPESAMLQAIFRDGSELRVPIADILGESISEMLRLVYGSGTSSLEGDTREFVQALTDIGWSPEINVFFARGVTEMTLTHEAFDSDFTKLGNHVIDLSGADLSAVKFGRADFRGAKLEGAKFTYAILGQSQFDPDALAGLDLSRAVLVERKLDNLDLTGTNLTGAILSGTSILGSTFSRTKLDGAILDHATLSGTFTEATFVGAKGMEPSFENATLTRCTFDRARFAAARFSGATLDNVSFAGAMLARSNFAGGKPATFANGVDFGGVDLQSADFTGAAMEAGKVKSNPPRFGGSLEKRTKLVNAKLHTGFLGRNWRYLDCSGATITFAADFSGELDASFATLPQCDFGSRPLYAAKFVSATLHGANFAHCDLEDSDFTNAILSGTDPGIKAANFNHANLIQAKFIGADLSGASFSFANLMAAKFTSSLLQLTDFTNAFVAQVDFTAIRDRRMAGINFAGACLVSARFQQTTIRAFSGKAPSFTNAILLGTNFTGATLHDADLTGAKLAGQRGTIVARVRDAQFDLEYDPTQLPPSITGPQTHCPDGRFGPCEAPRLITEVPKEWVMPTLSDRAS